MRFAIASALGFAATVGAQGLGFANVAEYQRLGVSHVALEVSYSIYPAIFETIDLLAEEVKPVLNRG